MRPARRADNSAVLVVPNVKVRMHAQLSIPPLSLHGLLGKTLRFYSKLRVFAFLLCWFQFGFHTILLHVLLLLQRM
jgi:hypothetical protein